MIAALFVQRGGCYWNLEGVDAWDEQRDARQYDGPWPVVAHPPCSRWSMLASVNQARYGHKIGDDGGCFASALSSVRRFGGVLEHPAESKAWPAFALPRPYRSGWSRDFTGGWSGEVSQRNYGHRANKRTWLYYVGDSPPPALNWRKPAPTSVWISTDRPRSELARRSVELMGKRERLMTPVPFRDLLLSIARSAAAKEAA